MKIIDTENWLTADSMMHYFKGFEVDDPLAFGARLVEATRSAKLSSDAPEEVSRLFEMARGAICYGYLFYPLYTLGYEQLGRCADAALQYKITNLEPSAVLRNFKARIDWALKRGVIAESAARHWDNIRELRNAGSHPNGETAMPPSWAIQQLNHTAELINSLFQTGT